MEFLAQRAVCFFDLPVRSRFINIEELVEVLCAEGEGEEAGQEEGL